MPGSLGRHVHERHLSGLRLRLLAALNRQLHALVAEIDGLTLHSGTRRLARYLNGRMLELPIAKHALASLLDVRPETLSRILVAYFE